jgi:uncharacterized protein YcfL
MKKHELKLYALLKCYSKCSCISIYTPLFRNILPRLKSHFIVFLGSLALLAACSTNTLDPHVTQVGRSGDLSIVDMRSQIGNNLLLAQTTFHNDGSSTKMGYYRCQFYDTNKMQVGSVQIWQPVTIYPNEDQVVMCRATQLEATDFRIEFSADGKNVTMAKYK